MRIWDVPVSILCRAHLLGEHRELHAVWNILTLNKSGYSKHPETKRWMGRLKALYNRHMAQVEEMGRRGYAHHSLLSVPAEGGPETNDIYVDLPDKQIIILQAKGCGCRVGKIIL